MAALDDTSGPMLVREGGRERGWRIIVNHGEGHFHISHLPVNNRMTPTSLMSHVWAHGLAAGGIFIQNIGGKLFKTWFSN